MNHVTPESKNAAIKTLAILGFLVMIIIAVWVAVQIVRMLPTAFMSLADLADGLYNRNEITLEEETLVANSGEQVTILFDGTHEVGSYSFSYACVEGVAVAIILEDRSKEFIACDEAFELEDNDSILLAVTSEKDRFADIDYTITFTPEDGSVPVSTDGKVTVVNNTIATGTVAVTNEGEENDNDAETPSAPTTPAKPTKPVAGKPITTIQYVTQIPVSDPNGFTDLAIKFISSTSIDADDEAEIKIEVKNIGTKTSKAFDLTIELPEGTEEEIENEKGLKPNERAVYTIEFDASDLEGKETIEGTVTVSDDKKSSNNSFHTTVRIDD